MEDSEPTIDDFISTIKEFCDFVIPITKDLESKKKLKSGTTSTMMVVKVALLTAFKPETLVLHYKNKVLVHKKQIEERNEKFFLENNDLYPGAEKEDINIFKDLWTGNDMMTKNEKETTWEFFDVLVEIVEGIILPESEN